MPIEAIATKQNPRSTTAGLQRSILRIIVCWSRRPNKVMAVNSPACWDIAATRLRAGHLLLLP